MIGRNAKRIPQLKAKIVQSGGIIDVINVLLVLILIRIEYVKMLTHYVLHGINWMEIAEAVILHLNYQVGNVF